MSINLKKPQGKKIFRFLVVADTHINQSETEAASFFPLNRLANARSRYVAALMNHMNASFVLHLGDIVHPIPGKPSYDHAAECFREIYSDIKIPINFVAGNHDIGDKPGASAPVATIQPGFIEKYRQTFGESWYSFDHGSAHFVIVNAPVMNSGLQEEGEQRLWLEGDLSKNRNKRIFIAIHYPPYVTSYDEPGSYDNIDEPARSWFLKLLEENNVEAVFCGHVHNFWYDHYGNAEIYLSPSTAFVRQDYSEFMRVCPPGEEGGRADVNKLGFFVVDVYDHGHAAMWVRSNGELKMKGSLAPVAVPDYEIHTKFSALTNLGVDLRHPWAELVELPPSGALEEFLRKSARNDYPLCAIWDMGITLLRVPLQDLVNDAVRRRMEIACSVGNKFILSLFGLPKDPAVLSLIQSNQKLLDSIELVLPMSEIQKSIDSLLKFKSSLEVPLFLGKLRRSEDSAVDGLRYGHLIFYGWVCEEWSLVEDLISELVNKSAIDGLTFRVGRSVDPRGVITSIQSNLAKLNLQLMLNVRLAGDDPAGQETSDDLNAVRVDLTAQLAINHPSVRFYLDTFMDVDRGYFRRSGLMDRTFNLRRAGEALRKNGILAAKLKR